MNHGMYQTADLLQVGTWYSRSRRDSTRNQPHSARSATLDAVSRETKTISGIRTVDPVTERDALKLQAVDAL